MFAPDWLVPKSGPACTWPFSFPEFYVCLEVTSSVTTFVVQEPEGSSPHSQQPATGLYPETVESNRPPAANLPKTHPDPILLSTPWSSE
jgi:hypothetical protein